MQSFWSLLRTNRNYRYIWLGQIVSEVGDHFNSIAVLTMALHLTGSGLAVGGVMISRTLLALIAGPVAGVSLDRIDRRRIMLASDLVRAVVALCFLLSLRYPNQWLLYALNGMLMFASPFFTAGRSAILPKITSPADMPTANALTQTTSWLTLSIGTMLGGVSTMQLGYNWAFLINSASFLFSAWAVYQLRSPTGDFRAERKHTEVAEKHPWRDFTECLAYIAHTPLVLAIALCTVGWASGGGAAQILFTLFGELVFHKGPAGVGLIWGFAGIGLVIGGVLGHRIGKQLPFPRYKNAIALAFFTLGTSYMLFSIMPTIGWAILFITLSRIAMGANNVLNRTMLLTHVPDAFRGRVLGIVESMLNATMMLSMMAAGVASQHYGVRTIGVAAGALSASTALFWSLANWTGKLPEPDPHPAP